MLKTLSLILTLTVAVVGANAQFYNGSYQEFGKNRVQYKGFEWRFHHYQKFKVYYYAGGENIAAYTARAVDKHLKELQKFFEFNLSDKIDILVFNRQSDFKMSNIGITTDESTNIGGVTRISGSKLFIYYEGDHRALEEQIRAGISEIMVQKMLYGDNWKEAIKSSTLLSMPSWYTEGFTAYLGKGWNTKIDNQVKDGILSGRYTQFNKLEGRDAELAGHSVWNFIAEKYGAKVLPQIFYMARISRNIESGFLFVLGMNLSTLSNEYINFYKKRYIQDNQSQLDVDFEELPLKQLRNAVYTQYKISPNGRYAAYVTNQLGQYKIWIYDIGEGKAKRIYKKDYKLDRTTDYSYPVINWHPTLNALTFFTEYKGFLNMNIYTVDDGENTILPLNNMDKVLDFAYNDDGTSLVLSGVNQGKTDLYLLKGVSRARVQLTNDIYDDLHPSFVEGTNKIIFSSNRPSDTIPKTRKAKETELIGGDYDIYIYDVKQKNKRQVLQRITDTDDADEFHPCKYDKINYTFTSDRNGIFNRYVAKYDSAISYIDTVIHYRYFSNEYALSNYKYNILQYDMHAPSGRIGFMTFADGKYHFYKSKSDTDKEFSPDLLHNTRFIAETSGKTKPKDDPFEKETIKVGKESKEGDDINIDHYEFEDDAPEFEKEVIKLDEATNTKEEEKKIAKTVKESTKPAFKLPQYELYKTNFAIDYLVTQLDNNFLFQSYQRYAGAGAVFYNPGFNGLVKLGVSDLFEDHKILGGFRMPVNFESGEYLLSYDNLAGRVDHKFIAYRNSFVAFDNDFTLSKVITHEGKYRASLPFDEVQSLRLTTGVRWDKHITKALDDVSINTPDENFFLGTAKLEYVFDAVRPKGLNLYNGTRFKIFAETFQEINKDQDRMYVVGADFRHYQKIYKDIIYAGRFAGSYSFGGKKIVYYLGGVDNWVFRPQESFNTQVQVPQSENFAFQAIGTPMRGFIQNIRNGSNFAVINNEIRVPIVKVLTNKPIKSDFLENFQIIGFNDIGTAWTGAHPYSNDNAFNTIVIEDNIYHIEIENQKDPIVYGYGFGLRSRLFGYFIRFDWAWGVDDGTRMKSIRYLSLSLDF